MNNPFRRATAEARIAPNAQLGMLVEIEVVEFSSFLRRVGDGDFDMHLLGTGGAYNVARLLDQYGRQAGACDRQRESIGSARWPRTPSHPTRTWRSSAFHSIDRPSALARSRRLR